MNRLERELLDLIRSGKARVDFHPPFAWLVRDHPLCVTVEVFDGKTICGARIGDRPPHYTGVEVVDEEVATELRKALDEAIKRQHQSRIEEQAEDIERYGLDGPSLSVIYSRA